MTYYAIRNKKTKKYITGTDYRYDPPHQMTSDDVFPPLLFTDLTLYPQIRQKEVSFRNYEVVTVDIRTLDPTPLTYKTLEAFEELYETAIKKLKSGQY